jgi:predicted TPR repeat methyltransferase
MNDTEQQQPSLNAPLNSYRPAKIGQVTGVIDEFVEMVSTPKRMLDRLLHRLNFAYEFGHKIAEQHAKEGRFKDALTRIKINLWLKKDYFPSYYLMGCCYVALGDNARAKNAFIQAAILNPQDACNNFMLATIDPYSVPSERQPTTMPYKIAMDYFTNIASSYDAMQSDAGYRGHQLADVAIWDALSRRRTNYEVLDLGCGTGLCGVLLAEHADYIVGVDFCQAMLDMASIRRRPNGARIYTELLHEDLRNYLADVKTARFDAICAAHVFNYVGEIAWVFDGAARALKEGGVWVFQVERYANEGYYGLLGGYGRFGHSDSYIRQHVARVGLHLTAADVVHVFPHYELVQYVVRKAPFDVN